MSKNIQNDSQKNDQQILNFKNGIDHDLLIMRYQESAKVIDYTKNQQWQITSAVIALLFGFQRLLQQNSDSLINCQRCIYFSIAGVGILLLFFLYCTALKHRKIVRILDENCLQGTAETERKKLIDLECWRCLTFISNLFFTLIYMAVIVVCTHICLSLSSL